MPSETFISSREVCGRYGMTLVTLKRYLDDERLGFPRPIIINARRRLWRLADLVEWEQARAALAPARQREGAHLDRREREDANS